MHAHRLLSPENGSPYGNMTPRCTAPSIDLEASDEEDTDVEGHVCGTGRPRAAPQPASTSKLF